MPEKQEQTIAIESESESEQEEFKSNGIKQPVIIEMAWGDYFSGMEGCAVFYNAKENEYMVYNQELNNTRRSPCSTFKIVSSLIGLESGGINPENENVYGKTGMGKAHGNVVDAWFVGFTFDGEQPIYFCIYLGESAVRHHSLGRPLHCGRTGKSELMGVDDRDGL